MVEVPYLQEGIVVGTVLHPVVDIVLHPVVDMHPPVDTVPVVVGTVLVVVDIVLVVVVDTVLVAEDKDLSKNTTLLFKITLQLSTGFDRYSNCTRVDSTTITWLHAMVLITLM